MTGALSFDEARAELEAIVRQLEGGTVGLDELLKLWERGEELYRVCAAKLDAAEGRIEELALREPPQKPETEQDNAA